MSLPITLLTDVIAEYLLVSDIGQLACVNKTFNIIATSDSTWRTLYHRDLSETSTPPDRAYRRAYREFLALIREQQPWKLRGPNTTYLELVRLGYDKIVLPYYHTRDSYSERSCIIGALAQHNRGDILPKLNLDGHNKIIIIKSAIIGGHIDLMTQYLTEINFSQPIYYCFDLAIKHNQKHIFEWVRQNSDKFHAGIDIDAVNMLLLTAARVDDNWFLQQCLDLGANDYNGALLKCRSVEMAIRLVALGANFFNQTLENALHKQLYPLVDYMISLGATFDHICYALLDFNLIYVLVVRYNVQIPPHQIESIKKMLNPDLIKDLYSKKRAMMEKLRTYFPH
jgi:hypothetical protein